MKIIFFIAARRLDKYAYKQIVDREHYRFVAILSKKDCKTGEKVKPYFDKIYYIENEFEDIFAELCYIEAFKIIADEIAHCKHSEISIICADELNILLAGRLRSAFNVKRGAREEILQRFKNKYLMKEKLKEAKDLNIRFPKYQLLKNNATPSYKELSSILGANIIIKPTSLTGSMGVHLIESEKDYNHFIKKIDLEAIQYIAEEFITGNVYSADLIYKPKTAIAAEVTTYSCPNYYFTCGENFCGIPLLHQHPLYEPLILFGKRCLDALEAPAGAYHLECFVKPDNEIVFLEVAAREPGLLVTDSYKTMFGVSMLDLNLSLQSKIQFSDIPKENFYCFWALFPMQEGTIVELIEPKIRSQFSFDWNVKVGDYTEATKSNLDALGSLFAWNSDYDVLLEDYKAIQKHVAARY